MTSPKIYILSFPDRLGNQKPELEERLQAKMQAPLIPIFLPMRLLRRDRQHLGLLHRFFGPRSGETPIFQKCCHLAETIRGRQ